MFPPFVWHAIDILVLTAPVWVPVLLAFIFWHSWIRYVRARFIANQETVLLEIRLPREIMKSPKAMELVLDGLHIKQGETTFINRWIEGKVRVWYSLEIVSIGGDIRYFVWTRQFYQRQVENQLYAQFPDLEIVPVADYTDTVAPDLNQYQIWGCDFALTNSNEPMLPIKTYVDYELDKDPKEELKIDPIANLVESLGSLQRGEQMWLQIMMQVTRQSWREKAKEQINALRDEATPKFTNDQGKETPGFPNPTDEQKEKMQALTRKMGKNAFDVGIRGIYIAEKDRFDPARIAMLTNIVKQFSSNTLNGFKPTHYLTKFDYPWQDFKGMRENASRKRVFDAYKRRSYFYSPHATQPFVLNTEELATLFHFPSRLTQPPTLSRIPSKRAAPPTNLPADSS